MKKFKDRITLGAVAGILASIPLQVFATLTHKYKITDVSYYYSASALFLNKDKTDTLGGKLISILVTCFGTGATGSFIAYLLSLTGKDNAMLKGAGVGAMQWIGMTGLLANKGLNVRSKRTITPLIGLFEHLSHGALCGYLITRMGDESLFPDKEVSEQEEIPVFYTRPCACRRRR